MSKRNSPLIFIDRTRSEAYPSDYVIVNDKDVGFVARVIELTDNQAIDDFSVAQCSARPNGDVLFHCYRFKKGGGVALLVEDFLHDFDITNKDRTRITSLLKRAVKKLLYAEADRVPAEIGLDSQIKQQALTIERAKQNYDDLVARAGGDRAVADHQIQLAQATLESLETLRNQRYLMFKN